VVADANPTANPEAIVIAPQYKKTATSGEMTTGWASMCLSPFSLVERARNSGVDIVQRIASLSSL
jgi:hypothetical protein